MDRRRFLGALGAATASAFAGCAVNPGNEESRGLTRATAVNHMAYAVSNYARTRDFYVEMFGMKVAWDDGTRCAVEFGDPRKPDGFYIVAAKPGEKGYINQCVRNLTETRDFYRDLFGMREIYWKPDGPNAQSMLRFGNNTLLLVASPRPDRGPYIDRFALETEGFDRAKVEAELRRRGYDPRPDSRLGWTIQDPEGMRIGVAGHGWADHVSRNCDGDPAKCPGV